MLLLKILKLKNQAKQVKADPVGLGLDIGMEAVSAVFMGPLLLTGGLTVLFGLLRYVAHIGFFGFFFWFMLIVSLIWIGVLVAIRRGVKNFARTTEMHMHSMYSDRSTGDVIDVTIDNEPEK